MIVRPVKTRIFQEKEDLFFFVAEYLKRLKENSVVVITSKIVALSEGRTALPKNEKEKAKIIKEESDFALPTKYVWMTLKNGMIMASAGIDESNANGKLILLPKNSFKSAKLLWKQLKKKYKLKNLGVVITDSRTAPLRRGVTGVALGYAGFKGVKDYQGKKDIFGRKFKFSRVDIADSLATAAVLTMGEGAEQMPLAIIKNAPVNFQNKTNKKELSIPIEEDMYLPLFSKFKQK